MNETMIKFSLPLREWMKIIAVKLLSTQFWWIQHQCLTQQWIKYWTLNDEIKLDYIDQKEFPFRVFCIHNCWSAIETSSKRTDSIFISFEWKRIYVHLYDEKGKAEKNPNKVVFKHRLTIMFLAPVNKMHGNKRVSETVSCPHLLPTAYYHLCWPSKEFCHFTTFTGSNYKYLAITEIMGIRGIKLNWIALFVAFASF